MISNTPGCQRGMVGCVSTKTEKGSEIQKFFTHGSWHRYTVCLEGSQGQVKTSYRQREGALSKGEEKKSLDTILWSSWAKTGWLLQIKKSCILVNFWGGILSKCYTRGRPVEVGRSLSQEWLRSHIRNLH